VYNVTKPSASTLMWICAERPPYALGRGPWKRNLPALFVATAPVPAGVYTPFAFDCLNDRSAPRIGLHEGDNTTPVSTCPVPIFARIGGVAPSGPPPLLSVGAQSV
jgi:hypothetical protein